MIPADGDIPAYCKVTATAGLQTDIEVRLPDNWQKRYLHIGGGGFDGSVPDLNRRNFSLQQGFALAASNGGHRTTTPDYPQADASFGLDYTLTQDYAYVAIGTTVRVAKALIAAYYGERPRYSYWTGCSNGGRGSYNAAAKYASEFDGIIAAAPTRNWAGAIASWMQNLPAMNLDSSQKAAIHAAMVAACDKLDGLEDGIISNPDDCNFDPGSVPGLNQSEIAIVNNLLSDITFSDGTLVYSRFGFGQLDSTFQYYILGVGNVGYIVYRDPAYDPVSWNLNNDYPAVASVIEGAYDFSADTDALVSYLKSGKKLIVWHGTDDTALSHYDTIRTMKELASAAGCYGRRNMRLYIVPGLGHYLNGPGARNVDWISAITDWVEKGKAPGTLPASREDNEGNVLFTRPQCVYPRYPHYISGDPNDAHSFICRRPEHVQ
jgi:feruloyl esterase